MAIVTDPKLLCGRLISFNQPPVDDGSLQPGETSNFMLDIARGAIAIEQDGTIGWCGDYTDIPKQYAALPVTDHGEKWILPGFIDAHLHYPQHRMLAAYGKDLLDWLNRYTFVEEQRYDDCSFCEAAAQQFLGELIRHGITACLAFSTLHPIASDTLFSQAKNLNMALITGRTMMDCNAPAPLCDTPQTAYDESKILIEKWHGVDRLGYAISPRFAVTSSEAQLELAGTLSQEYPDLIVQTHLSENPAEIAFVSEQFPWSKDYTDVYDKFSLLGQTSIFAHGIHLDDREIERLGEAGSAIIHCPTSNNFLGSGLFRFKEIASKPIAPAIGLGCDIGGGTSYSPFDTMRDAYCVSQLSGRRINPFEAFYAATLGNAKILGIDQQTGSLTKGKYADIVILDPQATPLLRNRMPLSTTLMDALFSIMILGDDRLVSETYIAGTGQKSLLPA